MAPERLRVLVVCDAAPERNGVGSYYADLVERLSPHVGRIELVHAAHPVAGGYLRSAFPLPGDRTQSLSMPRPLRLWRHAARLAPHVVVVPTPGPFGLAGMLVARRLGAPLVVGFHTDFIALTELYWRGPVGRLNASYLRWANRRLFRRAACTLANSAGTARQASALGAKSVSLMGTPLGGPFLIDSRVPRPGEGGRIVFAGRLAVEKHLPAVLELARARPALQVVVAGDGPLRNAVDAAAARLPNLEALGWVERDRLVRLIDASDAFVLPSTIESFGTVAFEAMARARPVVVSAGCGIADWPELADALLVLAPGESLVDGVDRLYAMPLTERRALGTRARAAALAVDAANTRQWLDRLATLAATASGTASGVVSGTAPAVARTVADPRHVAARSRRHAPDVLPR